jgi:ATP-dependent Clp protease ATP-binding subunit ClpA
MVGDPGVGKTAIAEGLAKKIHDKKVPKFSNSSLIIIIRALYATPQNVTNN